MSSFTGRYCDFVKTYAIFMKVSGVLLFHTNRAASATNVSCKCKKFLNCYQRDAFITGYYCCFFQIKFAAYWNTKYMNSGTASPGNKCFIHLFRWKPYCNSCMISIEIILIKIIESFSTGNAGMLDKPDRICFQCQIYHLRYYTTSCQVIQENFIL